MAVCWQVLFLIALAVHQEKESLTDADSETDDNKAFSFSQRAAAGQSCTVLHNIHTHTLIRGFLK